MRYYHLPQLALLEVQLAVVMVVEMVVQVHQARALALPPAVWSHLLTCPVSHQICSRPLAAPHLRSHMLGPVPPALAGEIIVTQAPPQPSHPVCLAHIKCALHLRFQM